MPRVYTRKFDWEEAARLREQGLSYERIGERLGVTAGAVYFALNDDARERQKQIVAAWQRDSTCPDCGAPSTRSGGSGRRRCTNCRDIRAATSVRDDALHCYRCKRWLPDDGFPLNRAGIKFRRGRHSLCRECNTEEKRDWRSRNPTYERDYMRRRRATA